MPEYSVDPDRPWLRSYDAGVAHSLNVPPITIPDYLRQAAERHPRQVATVFLGARLTYAQLRRDANRFAHGLAALGVKRGDRVAILLPNCPQTVIAYYAVLSLGAVAVMTNPLYTETELARQWAETSVDVAVVLDRLWKRVRQVRVTVPLRQVVVTGIQDYLSFPKNVLYPLRARREGTWVVIPAGADTHSFRDVMRGQPDSEPRVSLSPEDAACLQYTGGTTGIPKGAILTHANLVASVTQIRQFLMPGSQEAEDRIVAILPIFHVYGMNAVMNLGVHLAATLILLPLPDLSMLLQAVRSERPTFFLGIPALYAAINKFPGIEKLDLTSIKACFSGGAPLPVDVITRFEQLTGARIAEAYGLTEASSVTHVNPRFGRRKFGSVGLPIVGCDARIVDADTGSRDLPPGEIGEIAVRGPQVMKGYWRQPSESDAVLRDGPGGSWLFTGDLGKMDEDGYFCVLDRKKEIILSAGYNVYPREVEETLAQHPAVQECCVIGLPDALRGERIKAFVILKSGQTPLPVELIAFCRERLAPYKVPRAVEFRQALPRTATGKVSRRLLREEALAASHNARVVSVASALVDGEQG